MNNYTKEAMADGARFAPRNPVGFALTAWVAGMLGAVGAIVVAAGQSRTAGLVMLGCAAVSAVAARVFSKKPAA